MNNFNTVMSGGAAEDLDALLHAEVVSEGAHRARLLARRPAGTVLKL